ncbi:filamentous hemagglutinin N-terminal domain-containing protein [Caballeronia sp. LZ016]|uniref:two-partner secretion domain-containing protein n=1 Tax=Caballeronia sp. LZ016 TaxID=3038554 RepID=UPI0028547599|nr:filamentous hemagglutinin N-terminal domain-containing protein [Caballeronia sp. LZ016]MDR5740968.1 filamentous hemagglutinin N-terminal domain-containing protein [Caballeronia sp. LZ016]
MNDITCLRDRRHRREWQRAIRRLAKRAARGAGLEVRASALLPLLVLVAAPGAFALPVGENVVAGNVAINRPNPNAMTITQGSQKGIVNWNGFSIQGNERVDISQPSAQAVLLNRVVGNDASRIAGQLNANGQVFLVNPAGVMFARGASINVGSLVASTLGISNDAFLAGKYHFAQQGAAAGKVTNEAAINAAPGGAVALLGAQVDNSGHVSATLGKIALGAGSDITLDFAGDGLTMLKVNDKVANALVNNAGVLQADGGQIVMSARAADEAAASVLNQTGTVRARSIEARNGRIVLDGGTSGVTDIAGTLDASAPDGGAGGRIDVTGHHLAVNDGARIDASGAAGGGRVRVGGGAAGKETDIRNADALWMSPSAQVRADALAAGDGGNIVMYGTEAARVHGMVSAQGGAQRGNGGLVETSGRYLHTDGARIRLGAPMGHGGQWLLDPANIEIVTTAPSTLSAPQSSADPGSNTVTFSPGSGNSYVLADAVSNQLSEGVSVTISTSAADPTPGNGDITMNRGVVITKAGPAPVPDATLTLSAAGSIILSGQIGGDAPEASPAGRLNVVLDANQSQAADGVNRIVLSAASIGANGGFVTIGVPAPLAGTPAAATAFDGAAIGLSGATIDTTVLTASPGTGTGSITINGRGALTVPVPPDGSGQTPAQFPTGTPLAAVNMIDSTLATSIGAISINGESGAATPLATGGVSIIGNTRISSASGAIGIRGVAQTVPASSASLSTGVSAFGVALVPTTGSTVQGPSVLSDSGSIVIDGAAPDVQASTSVNGAGLRLERTTISTASGDVSAIGRAPAYPASVTAGSSRVDGVEVVGATLASGGRMLVQGTVQPGATPSTGVPGAGVTITGNGDASSSITSSAADVRIFGGGNGLPGVSLQGAAGGGNTRQVDVRAANGDIDIRGYTTGQPNDGAFFPGVQMSNASVTAEGDAHQVSVTGTAPGSAPGIALNDAVISAGRDPDAYEVSDTGGTLLLRATSGAGVPITVTTVSTAVSSSLFAPGGNLVFVPGSLAPDTFDIVAANAVPIDVGGSANGFTLTQPVLAQISPNVSNVIVGSSTHTGPITLSVNAPTTGSQALTLANGGEGSQGIALPAGFSGDTLTLHSAGTVTESGAGIQASTLDLIGPGVFELATAPNRIGSVSFSGTRDVRLTSAGDIGIVDPAGYTFDGATARVVPPTAVGATLGGSLDLRTTDGGEGGAGAIDASVPIVANAAGPATLAFHSSDVLNLRNDITSAGGPLDIVADARNAIIALGNAGEGAAYRIRLSTNGGNVTMGTFDGGPTGFDGATLQIRSTDIDTRGGAGGGNVTLHGVAPQQVSSGDGGGSFPAFGTPYGVDLNDATVSSGTGSIAVQGQSLNPAANAGGGVILRNAGNAAGVTPGPTRLVSSATDSAGGSAIRVYGTASGAGNHGVAMLDSASLEATNGAVDVRGATTGATADGYGALLWSGSIAAANVRVAGSGSSATPGIGIGGVSLPPNAEPGAPGFFIGANAAGAVILRPANNGSGSSLAVRSGPATIAAPGGTLAIAPGSVDPSSFAVLAQASIPITLFGTSATPGLSIDAASYQAFSPAISTLVLGSSTQSGRITVAGACAGGTGCVPRPGVATNLTLQNTGAGSRGIDLPSGIALPGKTLALVSSGPVTDPGGIEAQTLLLGGSIGDFDLIDAGNDVGLLALAGARDVRFSNSHGFVIGTAGANGFDGATGNVAAIAAQQPNVTRNLTAIADTGAIALGTPGAPANLIAGGDIDLVMQQGVFQNDAGGTLAAGNAWRVWTARRTDENRNGIDPGGALPNFYGCVYGGICSWNGQLSQNVVPATGNHFVYAQRPKVTVTIGNQTRAEGTPNGPFAFDVTGLLDGDSRGSSIAGGPLRSPATPGSPAGKYPIDGAFASPVGYEVVVQPGTLTVTPMQLQGAVFNRSGLQPLFTAQEQSFVYESNLGGINICVGTNEPILALQQAEGEADTLAAEWKRVRSRPNLNNCLVVDGQHGCGEF